MENKPMEILDDMDKLVEHLGQSREHLLKTGLIREATEDDRFCVTCGSLLGIACGEAEPDYDENHCSEGCHNG
tara:strand:+ start:329 stop:547 length:219 start_codon:yes stop_codon:yes gene_type:complete